MDIEAHRDPADWVAAEQAIEKQRQVEADTTP